MRRLFATLLALAVVVPSAQAQRGGNGNGGKDPLPITPEDTIRFTTNTASWMSVDVSPDGRTVVFDMLGDLYTLPIEGGRATRLTHGMAYDAQPRFSPDGTRVLFVSDRSGGENLWILALDGSDTTQVTTGNNYQYMSPEWAPDGDYVVASRSGGLGGAAKLWLMHTRGGSGVQLIQAPNGGNGGGGNISQLKTVGAAFGDDERYIYYAQRSGDWQYNAIFPQYQLAVYDRETGTRTTVSSRYGSAFRPALSPDGRWLVYGTRHDTQTGLRVRDLRTGVERWLAYPVQRDDQESRAPLDVLPGYAFTPDSRHVVASYGGRLWRVAVDGSGQQEIPFTVDVALPVKPRVAFDFSIDDDAQVTARQIRDAVPSPDGARLAFVAFDKLYVMDWPNGTPRRVTNQDVGEFEPTWSPDGRSLVYVTWADTLGGHVMRANADGRGSPRRLTEFPAYYRTPAWAPDGRRIVVERSAARDLQESVGGFGGGLASEFVWLPADGGAATRIAAAAGSGNPHFVADRPDRIYFNQSGEGLSSMRFDGTDIQRHLKVTGRSMPGSEGPPPQASGIWMAPRGDRALAQVGNDLYVVTVPVVGGATPTVSVADPANASFPARRLTEIGGQFPKWANDGETVHWSIGNAHVVYDVEAALAFEDSLKQAQRARGEAGDSAAADSANAPADSADADSDDPKYEPVERRITITAPRDRPEGTAVLRGGRALTMRGHEIIDNADIVIRGNRIQAIGARGSVAIPDGAEIIDISGTHVVPGFVDTHYHAQWLIPGLHVTQVWQYPANLAYGVTTTRDPQTGSTDILSYADRVETGEMVGPRIFSTGPGVFAGEQIRDQDHARNVLRRYAEYYDTKTLKMYMSGNRQQRQWIITAADELELMPTTEGGLDFALNLTHAIDGYSGLEHSLPIFPLYDDVLGLFANQKITYSPTLLVSYGGPFGENYYYATENVHGDPKLRRFTPHAELDAKARRRGNNPGPGGWFMEEEYVFDDHAEFVADLVEAGGSVGVGGHGQLQGLGYHWELWSMQSGGLSEHDALRAATIMGAEGIGFASDIGSLEAGKLADLVILDRDPLQNIRNSTAIRYVMKNGRLYRGDDLYETYPRQRPLPAGGYIAAEPAPAAGIPASR